MRSYEDFISRKRRQFGSLFSTEDLDERFVSYYENGQRIRIITALGIELSGCVGVSRNTRPTFILLRRRGPRSTLRVLHTLGPTDRITAVRIRGEWHEVQP